MMNIFSRITGRDVGELRTARKTAQQVNALSDQMQDMSYEDMQKRIVEMRGELATLVEKIPANDRLSLVRIDRKKGLPAYEHAIQKKLWELMPEVYAMMREVLSRQFNRRHYDVQIMAGAILAQGQKLVELKTGEGKTQVFQLPLVLYSLVGRGSHLVTVNEYLARRDGEYAGHALSKLGLKVGIISPGNTAYKFIPDDQIKELKGDEAWNDRQAIGDTPGLSDMKGLNLIECSKKEAYECDVTFGVNNEFGFDYLRDNMTTSLTELVQRELYFCVVDEADSILIDEARTPLIISALPETSDIEKYRRFAKIANKMEEGEDYEIDHKTRSATLTEKGLEKAEQALNVENLWADYSLAHHLDNAIKAKALYLRDDQYIVQGGEVLIVDTFTGRVMPGRRFSEGIHQAIEAKENVKIQEESKTMATITFQNYFRLYKHLCGGSGTVMTEAEEFFKIYNLDSVEVPTHHPIVREDMADLIYRNQDAKFKAVVKEVKARHEQGQPVLVGTTSVEKSELVSRLLDIEGVPHQVLNAKYHEREAQIVAKAGEKGAVMVATNMAGRGTDIPLGEGVKDIGGLAVIGTERHEARRIDNQLRGRSGRQGDPGYTRFYVSLDDQIMKVLGGEMMERMVGRLMQDDMPIEMRLISRQIETAQKRMEAMNFDTRKNLVDYDDVMNRHREVFYSRRRRLLELTDRAAAATESRAELTEKVRDIILGEVEFVIDAQLQGDSKLSSEDSVSGVTSAVLDLAPDTMIADAFDIDRSEDLDLQIKNAIRGRKREDIRTYLLPKVTRLIDVKFEEFGEDFVGVAKAVVLEAMNRLWMEHLETMQDIRSGIGLQSYAQKDPLTEYKTTGFQQFEELMKRTDSDVARRILKLSRVENQQLTIANNLVTNDAQISDILTGDREMLPGQSSNGVKVGRNDPCPCGSGKKYKHCGLKNTAEHREHMAQA